MDGITKLPPSPRFHCHVVHKAMGRHDLTYLINTLSIITFYFLKLSSPYRDAHKMLCFRCYVQISPPCSKAPVTLYALYEREQILTFSGAGFFLISNHETTQAFLHGEKIIKFTSCKKALVVLSVYVSIYV